MTKANVLASVLYRLAISLKNQDFKKLIFKCHRKDLIYTLSSMKFLTHCIGMKSISPYQAEKIVNLLKDTLANIYGIELIRFEIGTLVLPEDIQLKIDQKTEAMNAVELAKLDRQKQDEINQKIVDQQKAESEKELVRRQNEADAAAYEKEKASQAQLLVAENEVKIAEQQVQAAKLQKQAELEKQGAYTAQYFRDKELDVQMKAVESINKSVNTIVTNSDGDGFAALAGLKPILDAIGQ